MAAYAWIETALGRMLLISDGENLTGLHFEREKYFPSVEPYWTESPAMLVLARTAGQVREYFTGERDRFELPLAPAGTPFQQRVWQELLRIPYGTTVSYGEIARGIGAPRSVRAVGAAIGRNPISVVVPCHRVVGSNGALTGYAGGLDRKRALLVHERPRDLLG